MRKLLTGLFTLWSMTTMAGLPPTTLSGQYGTAKTTFNFKTPNVQSTVTSAGGLIETGNKNLLANPSFESSTVAANWTNTGGGTPTASTTNLQDGLKSVSTTSTGAWTFSQEPTLYATSKSGQEAEASIWVYSATASADLWLCPKINSVSVTASVANGCVQYTNLGSPQKLTIYMLFGSSSTGLEVKGSGAITYILDDAYLGDRRPSVLGVTTTPLIDGGVVVFTSTGSSPTKGTTSTDKMRWRRIGDRMTISYEYYQTAAGSAGTGTYLIGIPSGYTIDTSKLVSGTTLNTPNMGYTKVGTFSVTSGLAGYTDIDGAYVYDSTHIKLLTDIQVTNAGVLQANSGKDWAASGGNNNNAFSNTVVTVKGEITVPILEWAGDQNGFTTRCDDPRNCETDFSAKISGTTVSQQNTTSAFPWIASVTNGVTGEYTIALTTGLNSNNMNCEVTQLNSSGGTITTTQYVDSSTITNTSIKVVLATNSTKAASDFIISCHRQGSDYTNARTTQQIVQMRGVPSVPGASGGIDTFSVSYAGANPGTITSTVCSSNPCSIDQIGNAVSSIGWTSAGLMTMNLSKTYTALKCSLAAVGSANVVTLYDSAGGISALACKSCNSLKIQTYNITSGGTAQNSSGTLMCQGSY